MNENYDEDLEYQRAATAKTPSREKYENRFLCRNCGCYPGRRLSYLLLCETGACHSKHVDWLPTG